MIIKDLTKEYKYETLQTGRFIIKNQFVLKQKNTKYNKKYYILTKGIY
jgi:hypothetical protein